MSEKLLLVGSGRLAFQLAEIIRDIDCFGYYEIISFCRYAPDSASMPFKRIFELPSNFSYVAAIGNPHYRKKEMVYLSKHRGKHCCARNVLSNSALIDRSVKIQPNSGVIVLSGAILGSSSVIGAFSLIGSGTIIEHDCSIGDFCTMGPGVVICGSTKISELAFIGANATILQNIMIGTETVIGAGSVVLKSQGDKILCVGNPCREIKRLESGHNYL